MELDFNDAFEGDVILKVAESEYFKVEGDSDTRNKYDEI